MENQSPSSNANSGLSRRTDDAPDERDAEIAKLKERLGFYESFDQIIQENVARAGDLLRHAVSVRENADQVVGVAKQEVEDRRISERKEQRALLSTLLDDVTTMQGHVERLARKVADALDDIEATLPADSELDFLPSSAASPVAALVAAHEVEQLDDIALDPTPEEIAPEDLSTIAARIAAAHEPIVIESEVVAAESAQEAMIEPESDSFLGAADEVGEENTEPVAVSSTAELTGTEQLASAGQSEPDDALGASIPETTDEWVDAVSASNSEIPGEALPEVVLGEAIAVDEPITADKANEPVATIDQDAANSTEDSSDAESIETLQDVTGPVVETSEDVDFPEIAPFDLEAVIQESSETAAPGTVDLSEHSTDAVAEPAFEEHSGDSFPAFTEVEEALFDSSELNPVESIDLPEFSGEGSVLDVEEGESPTDPAEANADDTAGMTETPQQPEQAAGDDGVLSDDADAPNYIEAEQFFQAIEEVEQSAVAAPAALAEDPEIDAALTESRSHSEPFVEEQPIEEFPPAATESDGQDDPVTHSPLTSDIPAARPFPAGGLGTAPRPGTNELRNAALSRFIAPATPAGVRGIGTVVLVHGVPRATTALSLKRYLESLPHVSSVEPREYAEGILRLHVTSERSIHIDDLRGWSDGAGFEPVHLRDDLVEVRLPH